MEKLVNCTSIIVDCVENSLVSFGGPDYLGFNFNVPVDQVEQMRKFIVMTITSFGIPLANIYNIGDLNICIDKVWNKERIYKEISSKAKYLIDEASRYSSKSR